MISLLTVVGFILGGAPDVAAQAQRPGGNIDREAAKEKARQRTGDQKIDRNNTDLENRTDRNVDVDDDDGANVGAIVGGIAAAAVVGKLVAGGKGGDKPAADQKGAAQQAHTQSAAHHANAVQIDTNRDGNFTQDEVKTAVRSAFKTGDHNADGTLTRDEAVAAFGEQGGHYFDALDSKKTGSVAMDAIDADVAHAFEWADANGDGSISSAERTAADQEQQQAEKENAKKPGSAKKLVRKAKRAF
jgi:Ca2+-binding EF-hand superfamily protein